MNNLIEMKEITSKDYKEFIKKHKEVEIENVKLTIGGPKVIKELQPKNFTLETETVWSFPERGAWATHYLNSKYRGNWAPEIPRNLILKYTKEGDTVLDQMVGSGTTAI
jgi:DNA modification methylase